MGNRYRGWLAKLPVLERLNLVASPTFSSATKVRNDPAIVGSINSRKNRQYGRGLNPTIRSNTVQVSSHDAYRE